ncbi:MAG: prolipoprotein diacylglyceryl transferase [Candidatus Woesearchaeota archaeon]
MVFYNKLNPVFFSLGPIKIRWYGFFYALGVLFVYLYARACVKKGRVQNLSVEDFDALMSWIVIAMVIAARLFWVLVYGLPQGLITSPVEIVAVWHGGLSFHGGLIGAIVIGALLTRKKSISFLELADIFVTPAALALAIGRIGNFFNSELYGWQTNLPWGVNFNNEVDAAGNPVFRHPSQLYESLYSIVIFATLFVLQKNKGVISLKKGAAFALFLVMYSVFRFITELFRVPEIFIGPFTMGQLLNIPLFIVGLWLLLRKN